MKSEITLVYPDIKGNSGTKSYVQNTFNGLREIGLDFNTIAIKKGRSQLEENHILGFFFSTFLHY